METGETGETGETRQVVESRETGETKGVPKLTCTFVGCCLATKVL